MDFLFLLKTITDQVVSVVVIDSVTESELGRIELSAEEIAGNPIKRKIGPMSEDNGLMTITFSSSVKAC